MEDHSCFLEGLGYFGPYPSQDMLDTIKVECIVDLTCSSDQLTPYSYSGKVVKFPIPDGGVPDNMKEFLVLLYEISALLEQGLSIYIHCRGGHGRSGLVAACILCVFRNCSPIQSLEIVTNAHRKRKNIKKKWKKMVCPHQKDQRSWLFRQFSPIVFSEDRRYYTNHRLNVFSYVPKSPDLSYHHILNVVTEKFKTHPESKNFLLSTGGRPFIYRVEDNFWGIIGEDGQNMMGRILSQVRRAFVTCEV